MSSTTRKISLRPLQIDDFSTLVDWINAPHVARFWDGQTDLADVTKKYGPRVKADTKTHVFIANVNDVPIGMIQCYRHANYPDWNATVAIEKAAGIDYLIGNLEFVGQGIGPLIIQEMVKQAFKLYPDVDVVVSAPQQDNKASCRALEKAGFSLKEARKLDSDCISDAGVSCIYIRTRTA
ncbi:MAG: acetyltransferase [Cyanobacteria bacterium SZAS-4]|nr:acetyltransferase [Cyanobacteria bacterium SZAS-4]